MLSQTSTKPHNNLCRVIAVAVLFLLIPGMVEARPVYVSEKGAAVRSGPGPQHGVVDSPTFMTMLETLDEKSNQDWVYVKTPGGKKGWIKRTSIVLLKETPEVLAANKAAVDRTVAKKQALKWWTSVKESTTPLCDICNVRVPRNTGYLLTTQQVLSSQVYHQMLKTSYPEYYEKIIANFRKDRTPWCVGEECINKYFVHVPGSSDPEKLEQGLLADAELTKAMLRTIKKYYSIELLKEKVAKNEFWLAEDKESNTCYPITPLIGKSLLEELNQQEVQDKR